MRESQFVSLLLVVPALAVVSTFFVTPLGYSLVTAFVAESGGLTTAHFAKAFEFYSRDILFTVVIVVGDSSRPCYNPGRPKSLLV